MSYSDFGERVNGRYSFYTSVASLLFVERKSVFAFVCYTKSLACLKKWTYCT